MEHSLHNKVSIVHSTAPAVYTASTVGAEIDTKGFESCEFIIHIGTALVGGGFTALLEDSPDNGSGAPTGVWTAVADENRLGALPVSIATDANLVLRVGSISKERFQRLTLTETGTVSAGVIGATCVLGHPKNAPTTEQAT